MRFVATLMLLCWSVAGSAQIVPSRDPAEPRLQTVRYIPGEQVALTILPVTGMTVMFAPGELITRVTVSNNRALDVRVSSDRDSFLILPLVDRAGGTLEVATIKQSYRFVVTTGRGAMAGHLVRFVDSTRPPLEPVAPAARASLALNERWEYRMRGDRTVRPSDLFDNGVQTFVTFAPDRALPAVFSIGASGKEQVVDGHMRNGIFVIDRVHEELVFRIDKERARARRNEGPMRGNDR